MGHVKFQYENNCYNIHFPENKKKEVKIKLIVGRLASKYPHIFPYFVPSTKTINRPD